MGKKEKSYLKANFVPAVRFIMKTQRHNFILPFVSKFSPREPLLLAAAGENGGLALISGRDMISSQQNSYLVNAKIASENTILDLIFLKDSDTIVLASADESIRYFDIQTQLPKRSPSNIPDWRLLHKGAARSLTETNKGVIVGYENASIACWDERQIDPIFLKENISKKKELSITSVQSVTDDIFTIGDSFGRVSLWDLRNFKRLSKVPLPNSNQRIGVSSIDISHNQKYMAITRTNSTLTILEMEKLNHDDGR